MINIPRWIRCIGLLSTLLLLSGCWSSLDIKNVAVVLKTGIDQSEEGYNISIEVLDPSGGSQASNIVLQHTAATLHGFARDLIRVSKRRLLFTHNRIWVVKDSLAEENLLRVFDIIQRDENPRLSSYLFVTSDNPTEVLKSTPLFKNSTSVELSLGMDSVGYVSDYASNDVRETLRMLTEPPNTAYVPMIHIRKNVDRPVLEIGGTAIIKNGHMVGKLDTYETTGLLWLRNRVKGTSITVRGLSKHPIQVEARGLGSAMKPALQGDHLSVNVNVRLRGTIAEVPPGLQLTDEFIGKLEQRTSETVENQINATLQLLQEKYHTDSTGIGLTVYRKYPKEWNKMKSRWDEIFTNADISIHVETKIYHRGLINRTIEEKSKKKSEYNPFLPSTWKNNY